MPRRIHDGSDPELTRFRETFFYGPDAILVDELTRVDEAQRSLEARVDPRETFPVTRLQRAGAGHPAHVSGPDVVLMTGCLGCLHAWLFHGCRWDEGWIGFGNRIHRADFRFFATLDAPLVLSSRETRTRSGPRRMVMRFEFEFFQLGKPFYRGDQSAMFLLASELPG